MHKKNSSDSISSLGPKIWAQIPSELKYLPLLQFKKTILKTGVLLITQVSYVRNVNSI